MEGHPFNEAGRRAKAAVISYRLGRAGVDSTLKEIPDDPGPVWADLAEQILKDMAEQLAKSLIPPIDTSIQ
jgi:hypothetical protein